MIEKRKVLLRISKMFAAGLLTCLLGQAAQAATVQVGSCKTGLAQYPTIGAAITGAPSGSTIWICPGVYAEQLTITKNLTLEGATSGNSAGAIIIPPSAGLTENATDPAPGAAPGFPAVAAQIAVTGPATVNINHLTIDGTNNQVGCNALLLVGIYYLNANGTISYNSVRSQTTPACPGYQNGNGIYVEGGGNGQTSTSTTTISYNTVANYQKDGITANGYGDGSAGPASTIEDNVVIGQGPTTGAAENGIQVAFGGSSPLTSIKGNTVLDNIWAPDTNSGEGDAAAGILVYASSDITISGNTVGSAQFGISVNSDGAQSGDGNTITMNKVDGSQVWDGIDLCSNGNQVISNTVDMSANSGVHADDSCTETSGLSSGSSNTITQNTINTACAGVLVGANAASTTTSPNTYYNDVSEVSSGSDTCTEPTGVGTAATMKAAASAASSGHRLHPVPFK